MLGWSAGGKGQHLACRILQTKFQFKKPFKGLPFIRRLPLRKPYWKQNNCHMNMFSKADPEGCCRETKPRATTIASIAAQSIRASTIVSIAAQSIRATTIVSIAAQQPRATSIVTIAAPQPRASTIVSIAAQSPRTTTIVSIAAQSPRTTTIARLVQANKHRSTATAAGVSLVT